MSDQILMDNYLLILKSTVEVFVHGTLESSNDDIRSLLKCGLDETINHQSNTYDKMVEYGWYVINNVDNSNIKNVLSSVKNNQK